MCIDSVSRRSVLAGVAVGLGAIVLPRLPWASDPQHDNKNAGKKDSGHPAPAISADQALQMLKDGNKRFVDGKAQHPNLTPERIADTFANGQHPFATIISCSDSRVPVEYVFDRGIGDLFVIRVAGNVIHTDETGTAEYGAGHLLTPLILVLGHTKCGAVTAVVKGDKVGGSIPKLVDRIVPAAEKSKAKGLVGDELVLDAIRENVRQSIADLTASSEELQHLSKEGKIKIAGAVYRIDNGSVEWL
ncbi:MAG: carbonic anhydrase [Magnetococcales bacterium]|nr:carbonic anhydrase [Magnetococcales bacterium]